MLKSIYKPLLAVGVVILGLTSCKKNNLVIDQDPLIPPTFSKFNVLKAADTLQNYYVKNTNEPLKIPIGITTVSDVDRTVQLTFTSNSALSGIQYTAPTSIKIPAGKTVDTLVLQGLYSGYPTSTRKDTLTIKITGGDVAVGAYYNRYVVIMRKSCPVDLVALAGNYTNTNEYNSAGTFQYGPYTTSVTNLVLKPGSTTVATGKLTNLYDDSWNAIDATFDWSDPNPANWKVTITPPQPTGKSYSGAPTSVRTSSSALSVFNTCDRSITLNIDLVNGSTAILSNYQIRMK